MKPDWRPCSLGQPWFTNSYWLTYEVNGRRHVGIAKWSAASEEWTMPDPMHVCIEVVQGIAWDEIPSAYTDDRDQVAQVLPIDLDDQIVDPRAETNRFVNPEPRESDK